MSYYLFNIIFYLYISGDYVVEDVQQMIKDFVNYFFLHNFNKQFT